VKQSNSRFLIQILRLSGMSLIVFESIKNSLFGLIKIKKESKLNRPVTYSLHKKHNSAAD
jgi:hypothetical protein